LIKFNFITLIFTILKTLFHKYFNSCSQLKIVFLFKKMNRFFQIIDFLKTSKLINRELMAKSDSKAVVKFFNLKKFLQKPLSFDNLIIMFYIECYYYYRLIIIKTNRYVF
jgi:hypothetical protein